MVKSHGLSLRPLLLLLLEDDGSVEHEVRLARVEALRAATENQRRRPVALRDDGTIRISYRYLIMNQNNH